MARVENDGAPAQRMCRIEYRRPAAEYGGLLLSLVGLALLIAL